MSTELDSPTTAKAATPAPGALLVLDVMTSPVVGIHVNDNAWNAMERFGAAGTRHLVVVDTDGGCVGILTHHHIAALWPSDPLGLRAHRIGDLLGRAFAAVSPQATVAQAAAAMVEHGVDAVAVLDGGRQVIGVLTGGDIVRLVAADRTGTARESTDEP